MHATTRTLLLTLTVALGVPGWLAAGEASLAEDDAPITAETLPLRDEYWPHRVNLTSDWKPEGGEPPSRGVLLRVESSETARVDFGRRGGIQQVPVAVTDLVAGANAVRKKGPQAKIGNVTRLLGGALVDTRFEPWRAYRRSQVARQDFLLVAAPLDAVLLSSMAEPLAEIHRRDGVEVILLVQGEHANPEIFAVLRGIGWTMPFLRQGFIDTATDGYLGAEKRVPWLGLVTPNGRPLWEGPWPEDGNLQALRAAIEQRGKGHPSATAVAPSDGAPVDANL